MHTLTYIIIYRRAQVSTYIASKVNTCIRVNIQTRAYPYIHAYIQAHTRTTHIHT